MTKAWYWRSLPLEKRTGSEIFAAFFRPTAAPGIATLLESPYPTPIDHPQLSRYSICAGAPRIVDGIPQMWTLEVGEVFPFLEKLLQQGVEGDQVVLFFPCSPTSPSPLHWRLVGLAKLRCGMGN